MLVELLRPATPELARRWLAALLAVPENERAGVVDAVERQIIATYEHAEPDRTGPDHSKPDHAKADHANPEHEKVVGLDVVHPPVSREAYVEQVVVTYAAAPESTASAADSPEKRAKRRAASGAQSRAR
ncbi:MAG: hypothetical protein IT434_03840 [Phycisphaerales bacterium]|jgi:hypothetical protein|nr:hypothetical protein [Phycisphaerales bacterium]